MDRPQPLPGFSIPRPNALAWQWASAQDDFGYPLELSSSVYRVADISDLLARLRYRNPNTLEAAMAAIAGRFRGTHPRLISYETSVAFCAPLNLVQSVTPNRVGSNPQYSAAALANMFDRGRRIDVNAYSGMVPIACHQEIELKLVPGPDRPTVSVIIPCFQQGEYLGEAVESVVAQTFDDWEMVIVDDGSSDDTSATALSLKRRHPDRQIRLERQLNGGPASARNHGVRSSSGRYVLPLDADDRIDPLMLERLVPHLEQRAEMAIAYTDVQYFGDASGIGRAAEFDPELLPAANQLSYCSLYRRGVWHGAGGYDVSLPRGGYEDWEFWIAAVEAGFRAIRVPQALFHYRVGSGSMYSGAVARDRELRAAIARSHPALFTPWRRVRRFLKRMRRAMAWRTKAALLHVLPSKPSGSGGGR
jgi:glycosyltransferase involved in cell wall biosynthesis